ncbi:hypothetical protein [Bifidobacterium leontopitheci]|nr:hypothetical protein [Bifidobacterium leontopitheci]
MIRVDLSPIDVICNSCQVGDDPDNCGNLGGGDLFSSMISESATVF